uniref:Uncharacterized protein n=1 Tax=Lactuca sativa TaxID=4236 RepID=A0A9R1UEM5_LACSA|nr:hypothetical protein LSAT_V11C900456590 [Lactuca sativa]
MIMPFSGMVALSIDKISLKRKYFERGQNHHLCIQRVLQKGIQLLLQNRYQRQRLYTRFALKKARRMDVVWGETAGVKGQLWILLPILFVLQVIYYLFPN